MKKTVLSVLAIAFVSMPLFAQQPPHANMTPGKVFMIQFDADKDGKVTLQEFLKHPTAQFKAMDKNGDGIASEQEADAYAEEMRKRAQQMQKQAPAR